MVRVFSLMQHSRPHPEQARPPLPIARSPLRALLALYLAAVVWFRRSIDRQLNCSRAQVAPIGGL